MEIAQDLYDEVNEPDKRTRPFTEHALRILLKIVLKHALSIAVVQRRSTRPPRRSDIVSLNMSRKLKLNKMYE